MIGRNTKLPLNNAKEADGEPLILLHMGKERAVNIIPKKFNITMMDVFDVQIGNFTILSVFPETLNNLNISLPREKSLADDELDFHILVLLRQSSDPTVQDPLMDIKNSPSNREDLPGKSNNGADGKEETAVEEAPMAESLSLTLPAEIGANSEDCTATQSIFDAAADKSLASKIAEKNPEVVYILSLIHI